LLLRFWIEDPANGVTNIKGTVLLGLWDAFKEHRIEMPFPQRDVRIRDLPPSPALYRVAESEVTGEELR
jgi:small-conductance mechanosensitive channel